MTLLKSAWLLTLLLLGVAIAERRFRPKGEEGDWEERDWDVILFTQNWPVSECLQWKHDDPGASCNSADYTRWTVHGMWPTKLGTKGPGFCDDEQKFELSEIESIVEELTYRWLSIHSGYGQDAQFWKHEWEKHGTCATQLEVLNSELKYFNKGLDWNDKYDMRSILEQAGFSPGAGSASLESIYDAVQAVTATDPVVSCYYQKSTGKAFLLDVRLCFDKTLSPIDCDGVERSEDEPPLTQDCPEDKPIYYPDLSQLYADLYPSDNYLTP